jgi:hypothetical protein
VRHLAPSPWQIILGLIPTRHEHAILCFEHVTHYLTEEESGIDRRDSFSHPDERHVVLV